MWSISARRFRMVALAERASRCLMKARRSFGPLRTGSDAHLHRLRAVQDIGRHQGAVLGEGVRQGLGKFEVLEVVAIYDHLGFLLRATFLSINSALFAALVEVLKGQEGWSANAESPRAHARGPVAHRGCQCSPGVCLYLLFVMTTRLESTDMPSGRRTSRSRTFPSTAKKRRAVVGGWSIAVSRIKKSGPSWPTESVFPSTIRCMITSAERPT